MANDAEKKYDEVSYQPDSHVVKSLLRARASVQHFHPLFTAHFAKC